jgi:hypothetical protein
MAQTVTDKNGNRFTTTQRLLTKEVVRITGLNGIRGDWEKVQQGQVVQLSDYAIEKLSRYLRPVSSPQSTTQMRWQDEPATKAQLDYLAVLRVHIDGTLTKGQASAMIEAAKRGDAAVQYDDGAGSTEVY